MLQNPVIDGRINYLSKYLRNTGEGKEQYYVLNLALFTFFIENVSLFSQFAIIESFFKKRNLLKGVSNIVEATRKEELAHYKFGVFLINQVKKEFPEWFNDDFYDKIYRACIKAYEAEINIIHWIFEQGEINDIITIDSLDNFIKNRFNESMREIGGINIFEINEESLNELLWFNEEINAYLRTDFFNKQATNYTKHNIAITGDNIF